MIRWILLALAGVGFASLWGLGQGYVLFAGFLVLFANFATFCVLYDRPKDRARMRIADQIRKLNPHTDAAQRLSTARLIPTEADRHLGYGPMPALNLATGIAGGGLLVWGIMARIIGG